MVRDRLGQFDQSGKDSTQKRFDRPSMTSGRLGGESGWEYYSFYDER